MLDGSLRGGEVVVTITAATSQPGSETIHLELLHRHAGADTTLASADQTITVVDSSSVMQTRSLPIAALAVDCGDALVLRSTHPSGSQAVFPFAVALDLP